MRFYKEQQKQQEEKQEEQEEQQKEEEAQEEQQQDQQKEEQEEQEEQPEQQKHQQQTLQALLEEKLAMRLASKESPPLPEKSSPPPIRRDLGYLLIKLLLLGAILSVLLLVIFGITRNADLGMNPAVKHGDLVIYYRLDKEYTASDLVALTYEGTIQTRRVVATEGDTVDITEHGLTINGRIQDEIEVIGETLAYTEGISLPITLGADEVFLLGDSREQSEDSRLYGSVNVSDTLGKVMVIMRRRNL